MGTGEAELSAAIEENIRDYQAGHVEARQYHTVPTPVFSKSAPGASPRTILPRLNLPPRGAGAVQSGEVSRTATDAASTIAEATVPASSAAYPSPRDQVALGLSQMSLEPAQPSNSREA